MDDRLRAAILAADATSRAAAAGFANNPVHRALAGRFDGCDDPAEAARDLLADIGWLDDLLAPLIDLIAGDPLAQPPLRASRDRLRSSLILFEHPAVSLTVTCWSGSALAAASLPSSVIVTGRAAIMRYCGTGGATLLRWDAGAEASPFIGSEAPPAIPLAPLSVGNGDVVAIDGRRIGWLLTDPDADILTITATLHGNTGTLMREYACNDGRFLRAATLDGDAARSAMLLTLLRESGRTDATDCFENLTFHPAFFLRWEAMREWLALDAAAALPRLRAMAGDDPHPEIRDAACATLALVERKLAQTRVPCPA